MPVTYKKIASVTVGAGGAATIEFTSIPSTYTDLVLKMSARSSNTNINTKINFNGVTTGYSRRNLQGSGSAATSANASDAYIGPITGTGNGASIFASTEVYIPNYAGSTNKSYSVDMTQEDNATLSYALLFAGLWSNTAAITSITITTLDSAFNFVQYSTATLYGISKS